MLPFCKHLQLPIFICKDLDKDAAKISIYDFEK